MGDKSINYETQHPLQDALGLTYDLMIVMQCWLSAQHKMVPSFRICSRFFESFLPSCWLLAGRPARPSPGQSINWQDKRRSRSADVGATPLSTTAISGQCGVIINWWHAIISSRRRHRHRRRRCGGASANCGTTSARGPSPSSWLGGNCRPKHRTDILWQPSNW